MSEHVQLPIKFIVNPVPQIIQWQKKIKFKMKEGKEG